MKALKIMATLQSTDGTAFKHDLHAMGESADALKNDLSHLAHGAVDAARSGAGELRDGARHAIDSAKTRLSDAAGVARTEYDEAKHKAGEAANSLKCVITSNPMTSIAVAIGAGILLGLVVSRPRA